MRGDVLAAGRHDDVLLAIGDAEKAPIVEQADIPGVEPAFAVERVGGGLGFLVVAGHDMRPAGEDLSVRRDLDLDAGDGKSDGAEPQC